MLRKPSLYIVIGSRQKLLAESHNEINIKLEDQVISKVDHEKSLGLIIDNRLSWSNHVNELCKNGTSAIGALDVSGAYFSKVPIINGPCKLSPFSLKIEVSIELHVT